MKTNSQVTRISGPQMLSFFTEWVGGYKDEGLILSYMYAMLHVC